MKDKVKNKLLMIGTSCYVTLNILMLNINKTMGAVTFNKSAALSDVKNITDPLSNFLLLITLPVTLIGLILSYISWNGKEPEEKEQMPFLKIVKKQVIAYVILGLSGAALKWFSIS